MSVDKGLDKEVGEVGKVGRGQTINSLGGHL